MPAAPVPAHHLGKRSFLSPKPRAGRTGAREHSTDWVRPVGKLPPSAAAPSTLNGDKPQNCMCQDDRRGESHSTEPSRGPG